MSEERVNADELRYDDGVWHKNDLFTGVAVERWADGTPRMEQGYLQGAMHGLGRSWSRTGRLLEETPYQHGVVHGTARSWHENGQLAVERTARFGIVVSRRSYDEAGTLVEQFELDPQSPQAKEIARLEK